MPWPHQTGVIVMSLEGQRRHSDRLRNLSKNADQIARALYAASDEIRVAARKSITQGAVSGKGHIPSKPGEPPKADTGHLHTNITNEMVGPLKAEVRSHAEYAAALEFGTSKMAERPYMRPATKQAMPKVRDLIRVEVRRMVRES
jgi:HK97 gp10 family phage protein